MATDLGAYLDSSALVKMVADEPESQALRAAARGWAWIASSELALTEVGRAIHRKRAGRRAHEHSGLLAGMQALFEAVDLVPLDRVALVAAGALPGAWLRALDAIHIVAALEIIDGIDAFVTYDERQAEAAQAHGLPVAAPI